MPTFDEVARADRGHSVHVARAGPAGLRPRRATGARDVLELGTAHGVGAAYMAAAGAHVTTVDHAGAATTPPGGGRGQGGSSERVTIVREYSSYTWWLKELIAARSDAHGNVEPCFDFVYLDGAKNWTIDGLAVVLIEKLLRPGGWLLMDDLEWTYAQDPRPRGDRRHRPPRAVRARAHASRTCAPSST